MVTESSSMEHNSAPTTSTKQRSPQLKSSLRLTLAALASLAAVVSLAGCSSSTDASSTQSASSSSAGFPVTIGSTLGSTTITAKPTRVSTVGWTNQDAALSLGVVPVDMPKVTYGDPDGDGMNTWTKDALKRLGATGSKAPALHDETDDIDAEAIASSDPDVILGIQSGISKKQFSTLNKIAPTVAYPGLPWGTSWRTVVTETAKALGLESKGKTVISSTEKKISAALAQHPSIKGKTASVMYFDTSKLSSMTVYITTDPREQYLNDLGLKTPESVKKLSKNETAFYKTVSSENTDQFDDVDIIIVYGDQSTLKALQSDPLLGKIPAIKRGSVVLIDSSSELSAAVSPSILSIPATLSEYTKLIAAAADKVK